MIRYTVHYTGQVQGVGFRYTTQNIAEGLPVSGYVQNLSDGRVRLVVEGEKEQVDRLLDGITQYLGRYIHQQAVDQSPANGEFGQPGAGGGICDVRKSSWLRDLWVVRK